GVGKKPHPPPPPRSGEGEEDNSAPPLRFGEGVGGWGLCRRTSATHPRAGETVMVPMRRSASLSVLLLVALVVSAAPRQEDGEIARLIEQLGHSRFQVREQAMRRLVALGKAAVPAL